MSRIAIPVLLLIACAAGAAECYKEIACAQFPINYVFKPGPNGEVPPPKELCKIETPNALNEKSPYDPLFKAPGTFYPGKFLCGNVYDLKKTNPDVYERREDLLGEPTYCGHPVKGTDCTKI